MNTSQRGPTQKCSKTQTEKKKLFQKKKTHISVAGLMLTDACKLQ